MATQTIPQGFKLVPDDQQLEAPEGRGRAEAMRTFLARGGGLTRLGRYRHGPMKGKTVQQATSMFEDSWSKASGDVKDKYATRSRDVLAPSEKKAARIGTPAPPPTAKDMSPAAVQKRRMASYGYEFDKNGVAVPINRPNKTVATPAYDNDSSGVPDMLQRPHEQPAPTVVESSSLVPGSDEARAAALTETNREERFATADTGVGGMKAAVAMQRRSTALAGTPEEQARARQIAAEGSGFATADMGKEAMKAAIAMDKYQGKPVSASAEQTPIERVIDNTGDAIVGGVKTAWNWTAGKVTSPFTPSSERTVDLESEAARKTFEAKRAADEEYERKKQSAANAARLRREAGLPAVYTDLPTDERMHAQGKINGGPTPVVKAPRGIYDGSQMSSPSKPRIGTPSRIGPTPAGQELTGMKRGVPQYTPIGEVYGQTPRPADAVPAGGVGPVRAAATDESIRADYQSKQAPIAQRMMAPASPPKKPNATVATPAPRGPSVRPDGYVAPSMADDFARERRDAEYRAKSAAAGSQAVAAMGPAAKRFFTGKVKPLDQLLKR